MTNKKLTSQPNNQPAQPAKKIQKQRQRILKELEEAQQAQAEALERFHRAESRLQKRTADLQRVAAQLLLIQQQLGEPAGPIPLAVAMPSSERAHTEEGPATDESTPHDRGSSTSAQVEELPAATHHAQGPSTPVQTSTSSVESGDEFPTTNQQTVQISEVPTDAESSEDEFPAAAKHTSETQVSPAEPSNAIQEPVGSSAQPEQSIETPPAITETVISTQTVNIVSQEPLSPEQAAEIARETRAIAEIAEQAARQAAERAAEVAARLDQIGSGSRHLLNELQQLQIEADQADAIAQAAIRTAEEAEAQTQLLALTQSDTPIETQSTAPESLTGGTETKVLDPPVEADSSSPSPQRNAVERVSILRPTDDDENGLDQPNTATMIAGVAAAAAAQAEAIAEASSARTREARRLAHQADQILSDARAALHSGIWSGEDAEQYLQSLENEATRAHALLADAEAAEEQALHEASNAEVEAEVAEDLAFRTNNNQPEQNDNV